MHQEIINRIKSDYPVEREIVNLSTPVLSFGNFQKAEVFTLGINPSNLEFLGQNGELLSGNARRFETYESLKTKCYQDFNKDDLERIMEYCNNYFQINPYTRWFNQLEPILNLLGNSYYSGNAAHVDLVQWATKNKWAKLDEGIKEELMKEGRSFLEYQLGLENLKLLLLNGRTVINSFEQWGNVNLKYHETEGLKGKKAELVEGYYDDRVRVIGWSTNIQSSFGVTKEFVETLSNQVHILFKNI